jgi:hypothetical protein
MNPAPCRALLSRCEGFGDGDDDGTIDGETLVCTSCYFDLMPYSKSGALLNAEIPEALARFQAGRLPLWGRIRFR